LSIVGGKMSETKIACPYCKEPIEASAVKCKHCLEFLPNFAKGQSAEQLGISILELIGKALVPLTILIVALLFKPTLDRLLVKAQTAEFLGTKLSFSQTVSYSGDLNPLELFYLISSAENFGMEDSQKGGFNYDILVEKGHEAVFSSLVDKGLIEVTIVDNTTGDTMIFGDKTLESTPTEKGKDFLIELGLQFDGKTFIDAP
jgi:hypothetical protein